MTFTVVIPARFASTRLPGKPLLDIGGRPLLQHVFENAVRSGAEEVIVATDDERIRDVALAFGADVHMTPRDIASGTERVARVVTERSHPDSRIVVNVQGDEPMLDAELVTQVARDLSEREHIDIATLSVPITHSDDLFDPAVVKVVCGREDEALYFSRAPIPWHRDGFATAPGAMPAADYRRHIGVYAYRVGFLKRHVSWPPCAIERVESLEQLRALFYGGRIYVANASVAPGPGVDTPRDLERVRRLFS